MSDHVHEVTDASFAEEVLNAELPVVVDFWAPWCGPCLQVAPILESIAAEHTESIKIVKVNVDENPATAQRYGVTSIPTLAVISDGELVKQMVGAKPKAALLGDLKEFL